MLSIYLPKSLLLVNLCVINFSDCADLGAILRGEGLQLREGVGDIEKRISPLGEFSGNCDHDHYPRIKQILFFFELKQFILYMQTKKLFCYKIS